MAVNRKVDRTLLLMLIVGERLFVSSDSDCQVSMNGRVLKQRINRRKRSKLGDPRVDVCFAGNKMGINVSHLSWMNYHREEIPPNFDIHHIDENTQNNNPNNLIAVHKNDHYKLHKQLVEDETPF